jgi:hypothetical protein
MSGSPFRDQRLPPAEVRRIVARAVELAPLHDPDAAASGQALTREEIEQRAADLGLPVAAVRQAMGSAPAALASSPAPGGTARFVHDEEFDGDLPVEGHEDVADAVRSAMGPHPAHLEVVGRKLSWAANVYGAAVSITIRSKDGRTRLRIEETAQSRALVLVVAATIGLATVPIAAATAVGATRSAAVALIAVALALAVAYAAARALFQRAARKRAAVLERATGVVRAAVRSTVAPRGRPPVRIEALPAVPADSEAEEAALAEAAELAPQPSRVRGR